MKNLFVGIFAWIGIVNAAQSLAAKEHSGYRHHGDSHQPLEHSKKGGCGKGEKCHRETLIYEEPVEGPSPYLACPGGYVYDGTSCELIEEFEPRYSCKKGHKLFENSTCRATEIQPAVKQCLDPADTLLHGHCLTVETVEPISSCPHGFVETLGSDGCARTTKDPPTWRCPQGYKLKHGRCLSRTFHESVPECDHGYELIEEDGGFECILFKELEPQARCPHGFSLVDGFCLQTETARAIISCPAGYEWKSNGCWLPDAEVEAERICDQGQLSEDGRWCLVQEQAEPTVRCPHPYELQDGKCTRKTGHDLKAVCPKGFSLIRGGHAEELDLGFEEVCRRVYHLDAEMECPEGFSLSSSRHKRVCIRELVEEPEWICDDGFQLDINTNVCVAQTAVHAEYHCHEGELVDGMCRHYTELEPQYECTDLEDTLIHNLCEKKTVTQAEIKCKHGGHHHNGSCHDEVTRPLEPFCRVPVAMPYAGEITAMHETQAETKARTLRQKQKIYLSNGQCIEERDVKPEWTCPQGIPIHGGKKCKQDLVIGTPVTTCPKHMHGAILTTEGTCESLSSVPALLSCSRGLTLDARLERCFVGDANHHHHHRH